jgi:hypothetical protein
MDMGEMTHPSAAKVEGRSTFDKQIAKCFLNHVQVPPSQQDHWKYRSMNRTCQEIEP